MDSIARKESSLTLVQRSGAGVRYMVDPEWEPVLVAGEMITFDSIWNQAERAVIFRNTGRGGWSTVSRCQLGSTNDDSTEVFIKRQSNYTYRSAFTPWRRNAVIVRELRNIARFRRINVPTLQPIYFCERREAGSNRAILITLQLEGFISLQDLELDWRNHGRPLVHKRSSIILALAENIRRLHDHRLMHNCLYPKHIFIRSNIDCSVGVNNRQSVDVCFIDLEKCKYRPLSRMAMFRDLESLVRRSAGWTRTDRIRFLLAYLGSDRMDSSAKNIWRKLERKIGKRRGIVNGEEINSNAQNNTDRL